MCGENKPLVIFFPYMSIHHASIWHCVTYILQIHHRIISNKTQFFIGQPIFIN